MEVYVKMLFEKEALKDIDDFENIKRLYPKETHETISDIQSLISFGANQGTYMPKEADDLKDKLIEARIKQIVDFLDNIYKEQKKFVDIWFPKFKETYNANKEYLKLCYLSNNLVCDCLSVDDFYNKIISYKVSKNLGHKRIEIPIVRLLVKREKDLLCEYIKLDDSFGYSYITYKKKWFKTIEIKHIETKERSLPLINNLKNTTKLFIPYLEKQLTYFKEQEYKLRPKVNTETRWIEEDSIPTMEVRYDQRKYSLSK